jgi:nucleotide-binding universal stress UspA family protein
MKDILVQLDGGEAGPRRLEAAILLARRFGARLTGMFAQKETDAAALVARRPGTRLAEAAAASREAFTAATTAAGVTGRWLALAHGDPGFIVTELAFCARYFDLAVVGQGGSGDYPQLPDDAVERVILDSGRPVLVIPRTGPVGPLATRVAVAWNASREASRALHDSLPILAGAEAVTLLSVPRDTSPMPGELPEMDVIGHLAGHGVLARFERLRAEDIGVMDMLLSRAYDIGADLLVMGAPAGSSFGKSSGTRFLLRHLTLPVVISG